MKQKLKLISIVAVVAFIAAAGYMLGVYSEQTGTAMSLTKEAEAADKKAPPSLSPVKPLLKLDVYHPGTEALGPDEMRVTTCGTGMPTVRPKKAAAC